MLRSSNVTIVGGETDGAYPSACPYRPDTAFVELQGRVALGDEPNAAYALVRQGLVEMGLDRERVGNELWSPLGELVAPGHKVILKPNLVRHSHPEGGVYYSVVTHPSVVRALGDYVGKALQGRGEIVIGDAPVQGTNFDKVVQRTGLREVCEDLSRSWQVPVRLADFRLWAMGSLRTGAGHALEGDLDGYRTPDLGQDSMLVPLGSASEERFRVTCYDPDSMRAHHGNGRHEYLISGAVLDADVVINVPKMKTHAKVGLTVALKNLVGINGQKDWLPHHRVGSTSEGGDEYAYRSTFKSLTTKLDESIYRNGGSAFNYMRRFGIRALGRLTRLFDSDLIHEGSWYGNDTCWRMVLDLNRILVYADRSGNMTDSVQRRVLSIVDAIIAGEGEGPMRPTARHCNLILAGFNPVAVDAVAATIMGFDYRKLPLIANALTLKRWPLVQFDAAEIDVHSNCERFAGLQVGVPHSPLNFAPPRFWAGHVEFEDRVASERA